MSSTEYIIHVAEAINAYNKTNVRLIPGFEKGKLVDFDIKGEAIAPHQLLHQRFSYSSI